MIRESHFTLVIPYQPGTTRRSGKPCCGGSGTPFTSYASTASPSSLTDTLRAYDCSSPPSTPRSSPVKSASPASSRTPASSSSAAADDSAPARSADRLEQPRLAHDVRLDMRAAVPGALHRHGQLDRRPRAQLVQRERQGPLDEAVDLEPPGRNVDVRDVVVREQVVEPDRREVPAERLERHAVVARGELELLEADDLAHARDDNARAIETGMR